MTGCVETEGSRLPTGYGQRTVQWRQVSQHRVAFEQAWGIKIPPGMLIMHTCDNPPCVNPLHLMLGTIKTNADDMVRKGRHASQRQETCIRGHQFDGVAANGSRRCLTCHREATRARRAKDAVND